MAAGRAGGRRGPLPDGPAVWRQHPGRRGADAGGVAHGLRAPVRGARQQALSGGGAPLQLHHPEVVPRAHLLLPQDAHKQAEGRQERRGEAHGGSGDHARGAAEGDLPPRGLAGDAAAGGGQERGNGRSDKAGHRRQGRRRQGAGRGQEGGGEVRAPRRRGGADPGAGLQGAGGGHARHERGKERGGLPETEGDPGAEEHAEAAGRVHRCVRRLCLPDKGREEEVRLARECPHDEQPSRVPAGGQGPRRGPHPRACAHVGEALPPEGVLLV
mmetsp:Transcript_71764/g.200257  ORF Transcript_71764/g.200257 Transcript_71764/m.200257 type:complete len:271 (+) Transcript_71764:2288-3100(+)